LQSNVTEPFRDFLLLLEKYDVKYMIVGGYAFAYYAFPRYTKDLDIFIEYNKKNIRKANSVLTEFGSAFLLDENECPSTILQIGVGPNRIDVLMHLDNVSFGSAWKKRVRGKYGDIDVNWIGIDSLVKSKSNTGKTRHEEDVRILKKVRRMSEQ